MVIKYVHLWIPVRISDNRKEKFKIKKKKILYSTKFEMLHVYEE